MSVVTGDRTQGKLKVLLDAAELVKYTLSVIKNEKVFPKSYRWLLSQKIADEAVDAYTCIRRANAINVKTRKDFELRRSQQVKAYTHLEALIGLIAKSLQKASQTCPLRRLASTDSVRRCGTQKMFSQEKS